MIRTVHFDPHDGASMAWALVQIVDAIKERIAALEAENDFLISKIADLERDREDNAAAMEG